MFKQFISDSDEVLCHVDEMENRAWRGVMILM